MPTPFSSYERFMSLTRFLNGCLPLMRIDIQQVSDTPYLLISRVMSYGSLRPTFVAVAKIFIYEDATVLELLYGADPGDLDAIKSALAQFNPK